MAARAPRLPAPAPKRPLASPRPPTPIYRQVNDNRPAAPGPAVQTLLADRGPGRPLPSRLRESMELALGHTFAEIRIHTDAQAAAAATELHARAFTAGKDIFFAEGAFDPEAPAGRDLLAHELAHTATQSEGAPFDPALLEAAPGDPLSEQAVVVPEEPEPRLPDQAEPASVPEPSEAPAAVEGEAEGEAGAPEARGEGEGGREGRGGGAGEGEAAGDLATGESPPASRTDVEPLMPPPPDRPSPGQAERIEASVGAAGRAAGRAEDLPSAEASTTAARGAVVEPEAETRGRAEAMLAAALAERPAPSPEILELCEVIRASIKAKRPVDEDELVETDPAGVAEEAGAALNQNVQGEADRVDASYDELDDPPAGEAEQIGEPFETPPAEAALPDLQAAEAAPDPIPEENLSLDADAERADADMAAAGMDTPAAQVAQEGPVAEARAARGEVGELAQQSPAELAAAQDQAIADAQGDMAALQQQALESLNAARGGTVAGVAGQQGGMVASEQATREQVSTEARRIFTTAQTAVDGLLRPLPQTAMELWEAGIAKASTRFEQALAQVKAWIEERHSGVGGALLGAWDALTGLPGWVTEEYDRAEKQFGDDVCDLLIEISTQVNAVILTCELLISTARAQIDALFADLPEGLRAWAEEEKARLNGQLDQLGARVQSAQAEVTSGLRERAVSAVAEVQRRVAELREQARGILGKIADAIAAFIDDPVKFIIEGILKLLGISPAAFWAVVAKIKEVIDDIADDPLGFANNLVSAIAQGFQKFFDNFVDHLIGGFFEWLFSGLGAVGVRIPSDFSLSSIITFALELMGITWARIREILARHIGEENVALLEKAYELISTLIEQGPEGIFEMIKEQLNPQTILDQIIKAAVDFLIEALIRAVTPRIIALFNPAGAIVQAIEVIFRVLKWVFENAARIFSLIETVVGGAADLIAGNIGGMASAVEGALARLIAPVIDFLAGFLGLGDLPEKIAETIRGFQEMVLGIIDRVVAWLAERARSLLRALGIGEEAEAEETGGERAEDSELGTSVTFAGGGEVHRQWVEIQGTNAVLMVASDGPGPVEAKLAEWKASDKFPLDDPRRQEADGLIAQAEGLLGQADSKADALVTAFRQASQSAAEDSQEVPSDDPLESDQQRLVAALRRLFELFGGGPAILALVGEQLVNRVEGQDDTYFSGRSLPPPGYSMPLREQRIHIQRLRASDPDTPEVHLDDQGVLQLGPSRLRPAADEEKIRVYNTILSLVALGPLEGIEDVDRYRETMRQRVVAKVGSDLGTLDREVLSSSAIPPPYNRLRGEIFELWVQTNLHVARPGPVFKHPDLNMVKRLADGVTASEDAIVETKALAEVRPPDAREKLQMDDYGVIIGQVEGVLNRNGVITRLIYKEVRYIFNKPDLVRLWYAELEIRIGTGKFSAWPTLPPLRSESP
jgi:hypothetical protein